MIYVTLGRQRWCCLTINSKPTRPSLWPSAAWNCIQRRRRSLYCKDHRRGDKYETVSFDFLGYCFRPRSVKGPSSPNLFCGFTPAVSKSALNTMRATIRDLNIRTRTEVTLDDIARELDPKVRGWLAYYGQYTRSALYPIARYINQTLAVWLKRKYKRFHRRLGRARLFLVKIARENRRLFEHWQLGNAGETCLMGAG